MRRIEKTRLADRIKLATVMKGHRMSASEYLLTWVVGTKSGEHLALVALVISVAIGRNVSHLGGGHDSLLGSAAGLLGRSRILVALLLLILLLSGSPTLGTDLGGGLGIVAEQLLLGRTERGAGGASRLEARDLGKLLIVDLGQRQEG